MSQTGCMQCRRASYISVAPFCSQGALATNFLDSYMEGCQKHGPSWNVLRIWSSFRVPSVSRLHNTDSIPGENISMFKGLGGCRK